MPTTDALDLAQFRAAAALLAKAAPVHLRLEPHHPTGVHLALDTILNALPDLLALAEEAVAMKRANEFLARAPRSMASYHDDD